MTENTKINKRQVAREKRAAAVISAGTAGAELLYRKPAVLLLTGMGPTWLYTEIKAGRFPKPVKIGARAVAWRRSEVETWLASREVA